MDHQRHNQRIAYHNGRYLPEGEVRVPFRDRSFVFGDGCFDMARTFNGKPFRLKEHVERLYRSLAYLRIDIDLAPDEMLAVSEEVLERNRHLLHDGDDYWLGQRISRGVDAVGDEGWEQTGPTVIVECKPIPFADRAPYYRDGMPVVVPSVRRIAPDMLSPRVKTHNYLNLIMGNLEAAAHDPRAWALLLDEDGNLAEGLGSNVFVVKDRRLATPKEQKVLAGVSRQTVMDLAAEQGLSVAERDIDLYDAYTADEVFITSTSLCICPVSSINGAKVADGSVPGPVTRQLLDAYSALVGCDILGQFLQPRPVNDLGSRW
jgi:branched-chain amino acid aminotransferase